MAMFGLGYEKPLAGVGVISFFHLYGPTKQSTHLVEHLIPVFIRFAQAAWSDQNLLG